MHVADVQLEFSSGKYWDHLTVLERLIEGEASQRYERGSIATATNHVYKYWPKIFNHDATLTSAVLAGVRCSSARAAIGASSIAGHAAAASLEANCCARRHAGIGNRNAAGTVMASASAATGPGAAKARTGRMTHHGSRFIPTRCCTCPSSICDARGESVDVPQTGHRDALPLLLCTPGQPVRSSSLPARARPPALSLPHMALTWKYHGDRRRAQSADPALPLRRALAVGHRRFPTRRPFETPAHTEKLFESNSRREAEARLHHLIELKGIGPLTERAHEVSGTSKRGRLRQNYPVPSRRRRPASRPVSRGLPRSRAPTTTAPVRQRRMRCRTFFLTTTAVIIAITAAPVHALRAASALRQWGNNERNRASLDQK